MHNPLISIITVVYNGASTLEQTILNIINQTYKNIEYIIIDGGSTDGSVDIIKKYEDKITYWVSEPDKGIYDAMNKGIKLATGDWINFMNSGDCFYDNSVVFSILPYLSENNDVLYGDTILKNCKKKFKQYSLSKLKRHMPFCHQSCFVKSDIYQNCYFDLTYKYCADYKFFYNLYINGYKFARLPLIIVTYDENGVSSLNHRECMIEYAQIRGDRHRLKFKIYYYLMMCYLFVKRQSIINIGVV
jgi:glycosyltransferase involved in cell wall biosynthesis